MLLALVSITDSIASFPLSFLDRDYNGFHVHVYSFELCRLGGKAHSRQRLSFPSR